MSRIAVPPLACDCHMHVYEPRYPMAAQPMPPNATALDYRRMQAELGLSRVVVVQANGYRHDHRAMLDAIELFGAGARGVAIVGPKVEDAELQRLTDRGVRGARFHMLPGGALRWEQLDEVVARVRAFGWHVQLQLDGHELPGREAWLRELPVDCVIDHLGKFLGDGPPSPDAPAFRSLLALLDRGRCWVKLSAPYESSKSTAPLYDDLRPLARALVRSHPERCVWGSNWPHPGREPRPSDAELIDRLLDWADDDATRRRILADNPASLYRF